MGEFEVLQRRKGVNIRVNMKRRGDTFGEVALMFNCPRSATVAAIQDSVVWVLERDIFRQYVREVQESESAQLELFLNSGAPYGSTWMRERVAVGWAERLLDCRSCDGGAWCQALEFALSGPLLCPCSAHLGTAFTR